MTSRRHRHTAFYVYMAPFLELGDEQVIATARKEYRRKYKTQWRKAKRKQIKEITIAWEKDEYKNLKDEAKRHKESITRFIKRATIAYMDKRYVVPNEEQVTRVMQLLALIYNSISELKEEETIRQETGKKLLFDVCQLELDIRVQLFSPKTIEQVITEYIHKKPTHKSQLIEFIQVLEI